MLYELTIRFNVSKCDSKDEALELASSMLEHLSETFNDDDSLRTVGVEVQAVQ